MSDTQTQGDAPQTAENLAANDAAQTPTAPAAPAEEQQKPERLVDSSLEASHSDVLPLSPIESETKPVNGNEKSAEKQQRHGLRRGNAGRSGNRDVNKSSGPGIVENPGDVKETLSGKFVNGYDKDKEFRRAREQRRDAAIAREDAAAAHAQGWCLTGSDDPHCRHPQSNSNAGRGNKLIIEPAPIPEQEKDPSVWQKFKAKILAIFGLGKKRKNDKNRRNGKFRHDKNGKKFYGDKNGFRRDGKNNGGNRDFRGGKRHGRNRNRGRHNNSGARPQQNGGGNNTPAA